jgi:hypothetical protein
VGDSIDWSTYTGPYIDVIAGPGFPLDEDEDEEPTVCTAPEVGAAAAPIDVAPYGNSAGFTPQAPPTASEEPQQPSVGRQVGIGVAQGVAEIFFHGANTVLLNSLTGGGYGGLLLGESMWAGYREEGLLGAFMAINPFASLGLAGAGTYAAITRGDNQEAGRRGVHAVAALAAVAVTVAGGVAAVINKSGGAGAGANSGAAGPARGGASSSSYVYQLVDDAGEPVYYGVSKHPEIRLGQHARRPEGPFRGMQIISEPLPLPQANALETSLIQQAHAEGSMIYNTASSSISPTAPIATPRTVTPTETMLNPRLYPR